MGKNLAPVPKPTFYGLPPEPQLVLSERTPANSRLHEKWLRSTGNSVALSNTMYSLAPRDYYQDAASCAIDATNLAIGQVCTRLDLMHVGSVSQTHVRDACEI